MTSRHLSADFALQSSSCAALVVAAQHRCGGGVALLVEGRRYPNAGRLRIDGLSPCRHYVLAGAAHRFVRTDPVGVAHIEVRLTAPALVTLSPVI